MKDIPVQCTRCRHRHMESDRPGLPRKGSGIQMSDRICPRCGCKSFYDLTPIVAWCWSSGRIEFGHAAPAANLDGSGAIVFARGPKADLITVVGALARRGTGASKGMFLVPGVPEAEDPNAQIEALIRWVDWCTQGNGKRHRHHVVFERRANAA